METIYYRKIGDSAGLGLGLRITPVKIKNGKSIPSHRYIKVVSWEVARKVLEETHPGGQVFETSDMFKVRVDS